MSKSEEEFLSKFYYVNQDTVAYLEMKPKTTITALVLHQHAGIDHYIYQMVQNIITNDVSIMIPNLFSDQKSMASKSKRSQLSEDNDINYFLDFNHKATAMTIIDCISFLLKKQQKIILIGFSLGSAIGLKILQITNKVSYGLFFYGLPVLNTINPLKINCKVQLYVGKQDQIQFLSDPKTLQRAIKIYATNSKVEIFLLEKLNHGFLNHTAVNFSEASISKFRQIFKRIKEEVQQQKQIRFSMKNKNNKQNILQKSDQNSNQNSFEEQHDNIEAESLGEVNDKKEIDKKKKEEESGGCYLM